MRKNENKLSQNLDEISGSSGTISS
jgi:hypothetical protein